MFFERRERFGVEDKTVIRIINVNLQVIRFKTLLIRTALIYVTGPIQLAVRYHNYQNRSSQLHDRMTCAKLNRTETIDTRICISGRRPKTNTHVNGTNNFTRK